MLSMVEYVHSRIATFPPGLIAIDMTMGNGYDTLYLSVHCQEVYAFDIQEEAIKMTQQRIGANDHVHYILDDHQNFDKYVNTFDIAIFNLGYLPLGNHHVTTLLSSTKIAIQKAIEMMNLSLWIVVYPGHDEGAKEGLWLQEYVKTLDTHQFNVSCYSMLNKQKSPYVIEIEKRHSKKRFHK